MSFEDEARVKKSSKKNKTPNPKDRMSLDGSFLLDDDFLCSICLDLFTNPACTPCGHTFCLKCISKYWETTEICKCPLCKKAFAKRPELQINRTMREITEHFKSMRAERIGEGTKEAPSKRGKSHHHQINLLNELQRKISKPLHRHRGKSHDRALASSLPESQSLLPHSAPQFGSSPSPFGSSPSSPLSWSPLSASPPDNSPSPTQGPKFRPSIRPKPGRRFTVIGPGGVNSLPLCPEHNRAIMLYCQTDHMCICPECEETEHPDHDVTEVEAQWSQTKVKLVSLEQEVDDVIKERVSKLAEIREATNKLELSVQKQTAYSLSLFSSLAAAVERAQSDLLETLEMKRRGAELQAENEIREIQLELERLRTRKNQIEDLKETEDHVHALKTFPSLSVPPPTSAWPRPSLTFDLGAEVVYRSLSLQLHKFQDQIKTITETGFPDSFLDSSLTTMQPREKGVQEYAVDITLNRNTAHPRLVLSEDLKSVWYGERTQMLPDNPERFDRVVCVLGQQEICSGRHYWEVDVGGKTDWDVGVAKNSINRKGKLEVTPANGYWFLSLRDKKSLTFRTLPSTDVDLTLHPNKIGVFVDFDNGQVSFYNVDAKLHIYTFNDWFHDSVFPFFSPCTSKNGKNEAPLVITPVSPDHY